MFDLIRRFLYIFNRTPGAAPFPIQGMAKFLRRLGQGFNHARSFILQRIRHEAAAAHDHEQQHCGPDRARHMPCLQLPDQRGKRIADDDAQDQRNEEILGPVENEYAREYGQQDERKAVDVGGQPGGLRRLDGTVFFPASRNVDGCFMRIVHHASDRDR